METGNVKPMINKRLSNFSHLSYSPSRIFCYTLSMGLLLNKTKNIDGHGHSAISDGKYTISEIAQHVSGFAESMIFLTDHNTLEHFPGSLRAVFDATDSGKLPIIVPGIEVTCEIHGNRCHVIMLGGKDDGAITDFINKQRTRYVLREVRRINRISNKSNINLSEADYLDFCGPRTPSWTITLQYLTSLCNSEMAALELMRDSLLVEEANEWWHSMPSLADIYMFAQKQKSLLFLCHIGDLAQKLDKKQLNSAIEGFPKLWIDHSESKTHMSIDTALQEFPAALHRTNSGPLLVGTDYHSTFPSPAPVGIKLRQSLITTLLDAAHVRYRSPASFLVHAGIYPMLCGSEQIMRHSDVLIELAQGTIDEWVQKFIGHRNLEKSRMAEVIIALALLKDIQSEAFLSTLLLEAHFDEGATGVSSRITQIIKQHLSRKIVDRGDIVNVIALSDVCLRLGHHSLSSKLIGHTIKLFPDNFLLAYSTAITAVTGHNILLKLWQLLNEIRDASFAECRLIWRLKTPSSALNTVFRAYFNAGNCRHAISPDLGLNAATVLLGDKGATEDECHRLYNALVYDHLAATIIVKDDAGDYERLLSDLPLPQGWKIIAAEHLPRRSYHHRLWLLIDVPIHQDSSLVFELMVKRETDFNIGRAYQWGDKNCSLALTTSPWKQDGSFDRILAIKRLKKYNKICELLSTEVKEWQSQRN